MLPVGDGDWLVVDAVTKLGTRQTLRFHAGGLSSVDIPKGPRSKPVAANDNKPSAFVDAQTLLGLEFEPVKYVVPGYVA
ncbi:hypothetical protein AB4144_63190, partial [Rhizobiaceae sp. 2RAB30]